MQKLFFIFLLIIGCGELKNNDPNNNELIDNKDVKQIVLNDNSNNDQTLPERKFYLGKGNDDSECFIMSNNLIECYKNEKVVATYQAKGEKGEKGDRGNHGANGNDGNDGVNGESCSLENDYLICGEDQFDLMTLTANIQNGVDGNLSLILSSSISNEGGCITGTKLSFGIDDNENKILNTEEIDAVTYVCDGNDGLSITGTKGDTGDTGPSGNDGNDGINGNDGSNGNDGNDGILAGRYVTINSQQFYVSWFPHEWTTTYYKNEVTDIYVVHVGTGYQTRVMFSETSGPSFRSDSYNQFISYHNNSSCTSKIGDFVGGSVWNSSKGLIMVNGQSSKAFISTGVYTNQPQYQWNDANTNGVVDEGECTLLDSFGNLAMYEYVDMPQYNGSNILSTITTLQFD